MNSGAELYVQGVTRNALGETLVIAIPNNRVNVKVGDLLTLRYEIAHKDVLEATPNPERLNTKDVSLLVTKIEADRQGREIAELDAKSGAAAGFHLSGVGLEHVTPKCFLLAA